METRDTQREFLLSCITRDEAKESEYGAKASRLRKRYTRMYSEFQAKDRVKLITNDNKTKFGIIALVKFETSPIGYTYVINPTDKTFKNETKRKAYYYYYTNRSRSYNEIESIEKINQP